MYTLSHPVITATQLTIYVHIRALIKIKKSGKKEKKKQLTSLEGNLQISSECVQGPG